MLCKKKYIYIKEKSSKRNKWLTPPLNPFSVIDSNTAKGRNSLLLHKCEKAENIWETETSYISKPQTYKDIIFATRVEHTLRLAQRQLTIRIDSALFVQHTQHSSYKRRLPLGSEQAKAAEHTTSSRLKKLTAPVFAFFEHEWYQMRKPCCRFLLKYIFWVYYVFTPN